MGTSNHSEHAVTQPLKATTGTAESDRVDPQDSQSQGLAELNSVFRSVRAREADPEQEDRQTIKFGSRPPAREIRPQETLDLRQHYQDHDAEELILQSDAHDSESLREAGQRETATQAVNESKPDSQPELAVSDDVDDLNSYMENFLQRMRVNPASVPSREAAAEKTTQHAPAQSTQRQYSGPKSAPECKSDLAVMRQLANETTQVSLSDHASRHGKRIGRLMGLSFVCSVLSGAVAFWTPTVPSYSYIAAVALFGVAVFTAWRSWTDINRLMKSTRSPGKSPSVVQSVESDQSLSKV